MRLLFIASGYLPYTFSENLCTAKLVYAMHKEGWEVDVITRIGEGPAYSAEWTEPWIPLKEGCYEVRYNLDSKIERIYDTLRSSIKMRVLPEGGIRFASRACELAVKLHRERHYDALLTRAPCDIVHLVGLRLKTELGIPWLANWNDPANPIWPEPYTHHLPAWKQIREMTFTEECLKAADINSFPSQSLLDHFTEHFPSLAQQKTAVIPHIALVEEIMPKLREFSTSDKFRMCHSGNLSVERNPELTFKAMRELIDEGYDKMIFTILGYTNDYTKELINKYQLESYVDCIGGLPYMEALRKMQEFDCMVLLEARMKRGVFFASKFTDYAQLGKPILAISPIDGFAASTIKQYGGGISVDNEDYKDIKRGIQSLYHSWANKTLFTQYSTTELYGKVSAGYVMGIYKNLIKG